MNGIPYETDEWSKFHIRIYTVLAWWQTLFKLSEIWNKVLYNMMKEETTTPAYKIITQLYSSKGPKLG